jgi:hypothetical protein
MKYETDKWGRKKCTKLTPAPKNHEDQWWHPDAKDVGGGDNYDSYECPHCGEYFKCYLDEN